MASRKSGLALVIALLLSAASAFAAENPFASASARYQVAAEDGGKCGGKSGEGAKCGAKSGPKCGGMKAGEDKCGGHKAPAKARKDADTSEKAAGEGKCGAGKCGMKQPAEGKCGK